jgi:putative heme-binding domain-containing protein
MFRRSFFIVAVLAVGLSGVTAAQGKKKSPMKPAATSPSLLKSLPGFKIELLHTADPATEGSWICMCKDDKGRLIISGQNGQPILRVTLKDGKVEKIEKLNLPISEAMGLLYAFDSLYVNGAGPQGFGLYRCKDAKGDGQFSDVKALKVFGSGGEHGAHALVLGPDKKIYVINGNHTPVPKGLSPESPHRNYREDLLLPRQWDGNGHAAGILAPGGHVLRTDPDGKEWELVLAGFRNAYDFAFNADGELFTFDSDMEWDWGMPSYRPIRVNHCTSASEYGWRSGTGKWPESYPDSLPAVVNVGIGSPTGVSNGIGAKFPAKYQKALYALDWTYGRLLAVHLTPRGSSYTGTVENFVAPLSLTDANAAKGPLNLTDVVIGDDGAMYFITGGRNTPAGLYRVTYVGSESTAPANLHDEAGAKERKQRHELESFHGKANPGAIETAWPYLDSNDRFLRFAARVAIESQPVATWQSRALAENRPTASLTALLALARSAPREAQTDLLAALGRLPLDKLTAQQQLDKLRVLELTCIRQGKPDVDASKRLIAELDPLFPSKSEAVNREISQLLIYLEAPGIAGKVLKQMAVAKTQEDLNHYLFHLRTLPVGWWTLDQRREYFAYWSKDRKKLPHLPEVVKWFTDAGRDYGDGASYGNFYKNFFKEATANLSDAEHKALASLLAAIDKASIVSYETKPRPVVKTWKMDEIVGQLDQVEKGRDFNRGKEAYLAGQCIKCHRLGQEGGTVGPDLSAIASRFGRRDILESILEPSKVVSEQYQNEIVVTLSGKTIIGRVMADSGEALLIQPDPLVPDRVTVKKADVEERKRSNVSPMPEHLADVLTAAEILDLIAYLESSGNKNYKSFRK